MECAELYQDLLGLNTPWTVSRVELDMGKRQVDVHVGHADGARFGCPECGKELAVYDHQGERTWRHMWPAFINACTNQIPGAECMDKLSKDGQKGRRKKVASRIADRNNFRI